MIAIILPAFNEEEALPPLLDRIVGVRETAALDDVQVYVIDDGSTDSTASVVDGYHSRFPWIHRVDHPHNLGLSAGVQTGFRTVAYDADPDDILVTLDADNTQPPEIIPALLAQIEAGYDVVIASRFQPGAEVHGVPPLRRFYSRVMSVLFQLVFPIRGVRDFSCGFRAYRASVIQRAFDRYGEDGFITEPGFACMVEVLFQLDALGKVRFGEVPMVLHYDWKPTESKMNVGGTVRDTLRVGLRHRWTKNRPSL